MGLAPPQSGGMTALHLACIGGREEIALILIENGGKALLMQRNDLGATPVDLASVTDGGGFKQRLTYNAAATGADSNVFASRSVDAASEDEMAEVSRTSAQRAQVRQLGTRGRNSPDKLRVRV